MSGRTILAAAIALATPLALAAAAPDASARVRARPCPGRIVLATEAVRPQCAVRNSQHLDLLLEASDLSRALDACAAAGGEVKTIQIHRMTRPFGGIPAGAPYVRCSGVDH